MLHEMLQRIIIVSTSSPPLGKVEPNPSPKEPTFRQISRSIKKILKL